MKKKSSVKKPRPRASPSEGFRPMCPSGKQMQNKTDALLLFLFVLINTSVFSLLLFTHSNASLFQFVHSSFLASPPPFPPSPPSPSPTPAIATRFPNAGCGMAGQRGLKNLHTLFSTLLTMAATLLSPTGVKICVCTVNMPAKLPHITSVSNRSPMIHKSW